MPDNSVRTGSSRDESYVIRLPDGTEFGPLSQAEMRSVLNQGAVPPTAFIRRSRSTNWRLVVDVLSATKNKQTATALDSAPPASTVKPPPVPPPVMLPADDLIQSLRPGELSHAGTLNRVEATRPSTEVASGDAEGDKVLQGVFAIGGLTIAVVAVCAYLWVQQTFHLPPPIIRGVTKLAFFAALAAIGGIFAYLKACKVVK
jgi:hypothetical protein